MKWDIEYYEQSDGTQPAEAFEDGLYAQHRALSAKLARTVEELETQGFRLGGGKAEKCHDYPDLWEVRAIHSQTLARELFGFDGPRVVLLHGYVKRSGEPASLKDLNRAAQYWDDYQRTRRISPEQPE
jgi:hypothetical protein